MIIAGMTGVSIGTTGAMIEIGATIDGSEDGIAIIVIGTLIGDTTHAATTDGASSSTSPTESTARLTKNNDRPEGSHELPVDHFLPLLGRRNPGNARQEWRRPQAAFLSQAIHLFSLTSIMA
jgi:hypothetical protein